MATPEQQARNARILYAVLLSPFAFQLIGAAVCCAIVSRCRAAHDEAVVAVADKADVHARRMLASDGKDLAPLAEACKGKLQKGALVVYSGVDVHRGVGNPDAEHRYFHGSEPGLQMWSSEAVVDEYREGVGAAFSDVLFEFFWSWPDEVRWNSRRGPAAEDADHVAVVVLQDFEAPKVLEGEGTKMFSGGTADLQVTVMAPDGSARCEGVSRLHMPEDVFDGGRFARGVENKLFDVYRQSVPLTPVEVLCEGVDDALCEEAKRARQL